MGYIAFGQGEITSRVCWDHGYANELECLLKKKHTGTGCSSDYLVGGKVILIAETVIV